MVTPIEFITEMEGDEQMGIVEAEHFISALFGKSLIIQNCRGNILMQRRLQKSAQRHPVLRRHSLLSVKR